MAQKSNQLFGLSPGLGETEVSAALRETGANDRDDSKLHAAVVKDDFDLVKALVEHEAAVVDMQNKSGETPLHLAFTRHHRKIILYLLGMGTDMNKYDMYMNTPIHYLRCPELAQRLNLTEAFPKFQHRKLLRNVYG